MAHATRNTEKTANEWLPKLRRSLPFVLALLVLCAATLVIWWAQAQFAEQDDWKLQRIRIVGELRQLHVNDIQAALALQSGQTVAEVNMKQLTTAVSELPWVKQVEIRRQFPGELIVSVAERTPWLRLNTQQMLDSDGQAFSPKNVDAFLHLPRVVVDESQLDEAVQQFKSANEVLASIGITISELVLNGRGALTVRLNNDVALMFGRDDWQARLKRFVSLYPGLSHDGVLPRYVDLRYDTGVAVSWPETVKEKAPKTAGL